jgi:hypothetical protein
MSKLDLADKIVDLIEKHIEGSDIELFDAIDAVAAALAALTLSSAKEGLENGAIMSAAMLTTRHGMKMIEGMKK